MVSGYVLFGLLCICYYLFMAFYTKSFRQTFMAFWPVFAALQFLLAVVTGVAPVWCSYVIFAASAVCGIVFVLVEILILCGMVTVPPRRLDYIIILGARIHGEEVSESLDRRLSRGLRYLLENQETKVIVSGGKGRGESISEAEAMERWLLNHGVEEERIFQENKSTSTFENLEFSKSFADAKKDKVGIVTNNFHMYRAMRIGRAAGYKKLFGISAGCNPVMFFNYSVREFFCILLFIRKIRKIRKK